MNPAAPLTTEPVSPAAVTMEAFFTRQRANEGIELPLDLPDGTPTAHRIRIRGVDSDQFKAAKAESARRLSSLMLGREKSKATDVEVETERLTLMASLVVSWTFDAPCTLEGIVNLLREAPQLADQIDHIASRRSLFFVKGSTSSSPSLPQSSS